ncbi:hypothetical protein SLA2020_307630 [Shorea laevis]
MYRTEPQLYRYEHTDQLKPSRGVVSPTYTPFHAQHTSPPGRLYSGPCLLDSAPSGSLRFSFAWRSLPEPGGLCCCTLSNHQRIDPLRPLFSHHVLALSPAPTPYPLSTLGGQVLTRWPGWPSSPSRPASLRPGFRCPHSLSIEAANSHLCQSRAGAVCNEQT